VQNVTVTATLKLLPHCTYILPSCSCFKIGLIHNNIEFPWYNIITVWCLQTTETSGVLQGYSRGRNCNLQPKVQLAQIDMQRWGKVSLLLIFVNVLRPRFHAGINSFEETHDTGLLTLVVLHSHWARVAIAALPSLRSLCACSVNAASHPLSCDYTWFCAAQRRAT